jgi:predicted metal-dependent enzyme (double-stranded beta helix superfamily)
MSHEKLRGFISEIAQLVDDHLPEAQLLEQGAVSLSKLIAEDDWLPDTYAQPSPDRYQQFLLYADARQRFSVVSFRSHRMGSRRRVTRRGSRALVCTRRTRHACRVG